MIYLDNAATTKMFEGGADIYKKYACQSFFNPSAGYNKSIELAKELDGVRELIKRRLGTTKGSIIFTSGATESNNLAIIGSKRNGKWEYVFSLGEHPSVYNVARFLESQGHIVHFVGLTKNGQVDYEELRRVVNDKTRLISVMHVSNETGAVNDLVKIGEIRKERCPQALLHVDGVQAFCKLPFNIEDFNADLYTISAHKFHGPKGVGVLYVKNPSGLKNIVYGGGQEGGYRSGTENVPGIMAMKYAIENIDVEKNYQYVKGLKDCFIENIEKADGVSYLQTESPYILSLSFSGVNGETLMRALQDKDIYVGVGSACSTKKAGNRVLESMGMNIDEIKSHIRVSFSEELIRDDIQKACHDIIDTYYTILEKVR